jgi:hypothetical protein
MINIKDFEQDKWYKIKTDKGEFIGQCVGFRKTPTINIINMELRGVGKKGNFMHLSIPQDKIFKIEQLSHSVEVERQKRLQAQTKMTTSDKSDKTIIEIDQKGNAKETIIQSTPPQKEQRKSHLETLEESAQQEILAWMEKQKLKKKK